MTQPKNTSDTTAGVSKAVQLEADQLQTKVSRLLEDWKKKQGHIFDFGIKRDWKVNKVLYADLVWDKLPVRAYGMELERVWWIALLIAGYFLWVQQWIISVTTIMFAFLYWLVLKIKPRQLLFTVELRGVRIGEDLYSWDNLEQFWFARKGRYYVLYIKTNANYPPFLAVVVRSLKQAREMMLFLGHFLEYRIVDYQGAWDKFTYGEYVPPFDIISADEIIEREDKLAEELRNLTMRSVKFLKKYSQRQKLTVQVDR